MFAIIRTGGKQYKVTSNQVLVVERLETPEGESVSLDSVLMIGDGEKSQVGKPFLPGVSVSATVLEHIRADKIIVFKKKRRHNYRRKNGHRQDQTVLRIGAIDGKVSAAPKVAAKAVETSKTEKPSAAAAKPAKKAAPKKAE